jgi:hypothetical protein
MMPLLPVKKSRKRKEIEEGGMAAGEKFDSQNSDYTRMAPKVGLGNWQRKSGP